MLYNLGWSQVTPVLRCNKIHYEFVDLSTECAICFSYERVSQSWTRKILVYALLYHFYKDILFILLTVLVDKWRAFFTQNKATALILLSAIVLFYYFSFLLIFCSFLTPFPSFSPTASLPSFLSTFLSSF